MLDLQCKLGRNSNENSVVHRLGEGRRKNELKLMLAIHHAVLDWQDCFKVMLNPYEDGKLDSFSGRCKKATISRADGRCSGLNR